ncbi:putative linoleate 13S-lipoxygenase [Helianthus annuus]|uniref:Linoleate 13S-lipoxygenase n=1 Tax=Helianthus annuus TaxID=4232 RepID=A0A251TY35_HELAN|nr:linoleate 13S-lipoxygenase 2-1, chloroplastic [Helianthus annuus]KAF5783484.1 putative linoleate 13S-lipoxygenase [Helianthus annuus]KAJ0510995.1 putative linoleate 13S-lipoxygenase [Helianthus annuus]KAJ0518752.1 putative linoleate 13S-lipoxygenase [Helianthus annuus]
MGLKVVVTVGGVPGATENFQDLFGNKLILELVAEESNRGTKTLDACLTGKNPNDIKYEAEFELPTEFGSVGAIWIKNEHGKETFVKSVVIEGLSDPLTISCNSWVHSNDDNPEKRVFFVDKLSCVPSKTPSGLKPLREKELAILRGEGAADVPRGKKDRIYDYDMYNDLGDPDKDSDLVRPILGGTDHPYPRRCKTGRPRSTSDPLSESRSTEVYVPRDEAFSEVEKGTFNLKTVFLALATATASLKNREDDKQFSDFTNIEFLFKIGVELPNLNDNGRLQEMLPRLFKYSESTQKNVLRFETPETIKRDKFGWISDEEFGRQTLAGINPLSITLVKEWPLKSKLDPKEYGPSESAITTEIVMGMIPGFSTIDEEIENKKLYMLDYHDIFLPYVHKVREQKNTTLYGSRTLMYLTPTGTLRPIAIELVRPPKDDKPLWKKVFTPGWDATSMWLWKLAKVHVLAHDSGYHQLVSHWLRTHCCTEPYIIATNRQLSKMHPIHSLLHPHFRYTMAINALARGALINAGGTIEMCFSLGKYGTELSSVAYDQLWRFDQEALPADLIARGMAVEDPDSPHGLKLSIEDYPYANDGLRLWDIIKNWVTDYVNHYYPEENLVKSDEELHAWWTEIRKVGHADKQDEPWWPILNTPKDLIWILTTIIWVASGHHAAVNFGQYDYAGYFPNRAPIARVKMPCEDPTDVEWEKFKCKPEDVLLSALPSQGQAIQVMAVLDVLSNHSPDEEYIGDKMEPTFEANPQIKDAYEKFKENVQKLGTIIDGRNADESLRNRNGVGVVPYNLLKPSSEAGVTGMGVPNSISI